MTISYLRYLALLGGASSLLNWNVAYGMDRFAPLSEGDKPAGEVALRAHYKSILEQTPRICDPYVPSRNPDQYPKGFQGLSSGILQGLFLKSKSAIDVHNAGGQAPANPAVPPVNLPQPGNLSGQPNFQQQLQAAIVQEQQRLKVEHQQQLEAAIAQEQQKLKVEHQQQLQVAIAQPPVIPEGYLSHQDHKAALDAKDETLKHLQHQLAEKDTEHKTALDAALENLQRQLIQKDTDHANAMIKANADYEALARIAHGALAGVEAQVGLISGDGHASSSVAPLPVRADAPPPPPPLPRAKASGAAMPDFNPRNILGGEGNLKHGDPSNKPEGPEVTSTGIDAVAQQIQAGRVSLNDASMRPPVPKRDSKHIGGLASALDQIRDKKKSELSSADAELLTKINEAIEHRTFISAFVATGKDTPSFNAFSPVAAPAESKNEGLISILARRIAVAGEEEIDYETDNDDWSDDEKPKKLTKSDKKKSEVADLASSVKRLGPDLHKFKRIRQVYRDAIKAHNDKQTKKSDSLEPMPEKGTHKNLMLLWEWKHYKDNSKMIDELVEKYIEENQEMLKLKYVDVDFENVTQDYKTSTLIAKAVGSDMQASVVVRSGKK